MLRPLVGIWFQVHVSSPSRGSSHLSIALLSSLSVVREYLALRDGPRRFRSGFHVARPTQVPLERLLVVAYGTVTLYGPTFQTDSVNQQLCNSHVKGPTTPQRKTSAVWAVPLSLAATDGIDFSFFSCGY